MRPYHLPVFMVTKTPTQWREMLYYTLFFVFTLATCLHTRTNPQGEELPWVFKRWGAVHQGLILVLVFRRYVMMHWDSLYPVQHELCRVQRWLRSGQSSRLDITTNTSLSHFSWKNSLMASSLFLRLHFIFNTQILPRAYFGHSCSILVLQFWIARLCLSQNVGNGAISVFQNYFHA